MKKSRFTEEQMVQSLVEGDKGGKTITELCKKRGILLVTYYNWS